MAGGRSRLSACFRRTAWFLGFALPRDTAVARNARATKKSKMWVNPSPRTDQAHWCLDTFAAGFSVHISDHDYDEKPQVSKLEQGTTKT